MIGKVTDIRQRIAGPKIVVTEGFRSVLISGTIETMEEPEIGIVTISPTPRTALLAGRLVDACAGQDTDVMGFVVEDLMTLDRRETLEVMVALAGSTLKFAQDHDPENWRAGISTGLARLTAIAAESA